MTEANWNRALVLGSWLLLCATVWVRLDVEWGDVSSGDRLNAFIGAGIGAIGIGLGALGYQITRRQGEIAEEQHRLMKEQLERRAVLSLKPQWTRGHEPKTARVTLAAHNDGKRSAAEYYWHVLIPDIDGYGQFLVKHAANRTTDSPTFDGIRYVHFAGLHREPVFPGRPVKLGSFEVDTGKAPGVASVRWRLEAEDGGFPEGTEYGVIEFHLDHLTLVDNSGQP